MTERRRERHRPGRFGGIDRRTYLWPAAFAGLFVQAGCSQSTDSYGTTGQASEPPSAVVTDVATGLSAPPAPAAPVGNPAPVDGRYEIIEANGTNLLVTIAADRSFTVSRDGRTIAQGTVEQGPDGSVCGRYTNGARQCFMLGRPEADGSFAVQNENGTILRGRRLDPAPAQATAARTS